MSTGAQRFTELFAWQACYVYKKAVYRLCLEAPLSRDWDRRDQLEKAVKGPPAHVAEGFGRFNPPDFAQFCVYARASLMESQNHLIDAVDKGYITEDTRLELNALAVTALEEVTGLMEYLQSPEALRNARRLRERRVASRQKRLSARGPRAKGRATNNEQGTSNNEQGTPNPEPGTANREPRTCEPNAEDEPRTKNPEE